MKKLVFTFLTLLFITEVNAQQKEFNAEKKIHEFLSDSINRNKVADTTTFYAFAFKLTLKKIENSKVVVENIETNDSIAIIFYPSYKQMAAINYEEFLREKKEAVLIIPVLIGVWGTKYQTIKKNNLEDMDKYAALFFNRKDTKEPPSNNFRYIIPDSKNYIYLFPYISIFSLRSYY